MHQSGKLNFSKASPTRYACVQFANTKKFKHNFLKVKEYIRRAKAWRNRVWGQIPDGRPSSYLMSLLVVKAYETIHSGETLVTTEIIII